MKSRARIGNHPLHPMLIVIPAGAFISTLVFDIVYVLTRAEVWWQATVPLLVVGVIGALVAAIPGLIDLVTIAPRQGAKRIGIIHMVSNLILVALFAVNAWVRWDAAPPRAGGTYGGLWLSLIGVALLGVSGWLGWKMVYEHHVGVLEHPEAKDPEPFEVPAGGPVQHHSQPPAP